MKKYSITALILFLAVALTACSAAGQSGGGMSETPAPADDDMVRISVSSEFGGDKVKLDAEASAYILELLEQDGWEEGTHDCIRDVMLSLPDSQVYYSSGCGTFTDLDGPRVLTLSDGEQQTVNAILSRCVALGLYEPYDWGITLTLKDLTPSGATIVCTQSGGSPTGELSTGSYYVVQRLTEGGWESLEYLELEGELAWTAEAWIINMDGTTEWEINWEWLYGQLPDGHYRIGKEFMDFRATGNYDTMMIYAEFSFSQMLISE